MKFLILSLLSFSVYAQDSVKDFKGCLAWKKLGETQVHTNNAVCNQATIPHSTFKLPNTLIGLETGAITVDEKIKWDGKPKTLKEWEQDHALATAIKVSCVPYYQELARRVGPKRMNEWLKKLNYGNQQTGEIIDNFWLKGPLKITPVEQVAFMEKLYTNKLPVKAENAETLRSIIIHEDQPNWRFSGKTGSNITDGKMTRGWFVGHVKTDKGEYVFAILEEADGVGGRVVMDKAKKYLKELAL